MRLPEGLPELRGRSLAAYRMLWWVLLPLAVLGATAGEWSSARFRWDTLEAIYGAGIRVHYDNQRIEIVPLSAEAKTAGVVEGSILLAVNGRPVVATSPNVWARNLVASMKAREGSVLALKLRAPDGTVAVYRVTHSAANFRATERDAPISHWNRFVISTAAELILYLISLAAGALLFRGRPRDPVAACLSIGLLAADASFTSSIVSSPVIETLVSGSLNAIGLAALMLGMAVFPAGQFSPRLTWFALPVIAVAAIGQLFANTLSDWPAFAQVAAILVVLATLVWRYVKLPVGLQRQQIKWVVLGFALLATSQILVILSSLFQTSDTSTSTLFAVLLVQNLATPLGWLSMIGALVVSVLRHRLYDADAAISRSALYGGLTLTLVAVFAGCEKLIEKIGEEYFGSSAGIAAGAIAAALAALFLVPLHHRMSHWAEKRFQHDLARLRAGMPELLAEMRDSAHLEELAADALRLVVRGVRASGGAILLDHDGKFELSDVEGTARGAGAERLAAELPRRAEPGLLLADDDADFPVRLPLLTPSCVLAGWLALGPHPDGSLYGKDDREALEELASPLARALCLAMARARSEAERNTERRATHEQLLKLDDKIGQLLALLAPREAGAA